MPNHVTNKIICSGPVEDVAAFKDLMITEDPSGPLISHDDGSASLCSKALMFDLSRAVPEPRILTMISDPLRRLENGKFAMNGGDQGSGETWREATDEEQAEIERLNTEVPQLGIWQLPPDRDRMMPLWYDWRVEHWGTKWNSYSFSEKKNEATYAFSFDTAWASPSPVLDRLVERFPNLTFDVKWFDEGWNHAGEGTLGVNGSDFSADDLSKEPSDALYQQVYGEAPVHYDEDGNILPSTLSTTTFDQDLFNRVSSLIGGAMQDAVYDSDIQRDLQISLNSPYVCKVARSIYGLLDLSVEDSVTPPSILSGYGETVTISDAFMEEAESVRIATNFTCFNVSVSSDDQGYFPLSGTVYCDDVELSDDALFQMRDIRDRIMQSALQ